MQQANNQNQVNNEGLFLQGRFMGFIENHRTGNDGSPWVQHFAGVEMVKPNGFPGETIVERLQVPKDLISQGITGKFNDLIGKPVKIECWIRAYSTRGGASYSLQLANHMDAIRSAGSAELKKAV
jgi:hypothetical protein